MEEFIHQQTLILLKKQLDEVKDEATRAMIMRLLAEEEGQGIRQQQSDDEGLGPSGVK